MAITHTPLCTVDWCAHPSDPDWHVCIVCQSPAVQHAHVESRSHNPSRRKDKTNQVMLCVLHHQEVDLRQNGTHGHAIRRIPGRGRLYFRFDLHGNTTFQKVLPCDDTEQPTIIDASGQQDSVTSQADEGRISSPERQLASHPSPAPASPGLTNDTAVGAQPGLAHMDAFSLTEGCQEGMQLLYWGLKLKDATDEFRWQIGDWLVRMEEVLGEPAYQYFEPLKEAFGYDAIRQYKSVAERVTRVTRIDELPWSTHRAIAALPEKAQAAALLTAKEEGLTSREVAAMVRPEPPERAKHNCPLCNWPHWVPVQEDWKEPAPKPEPEYVGEEAAQGALAETPFE